MKLSIIGSGNVATHIALATKSVGIKINSIWSNQFSNAEILAEKVGANTSATISEMINDDNDIIIISVKDDAIEEVATQLKGFNGIVCHTSGAVNLNTLSGFGQFGVFYPLQTFSKQVDLNFREVPICVEANNEESLTTLNLLAAKLSDSVYTVDSEKRKTLHLAAVFACNFPNYLFGIAQQLLAKDNLDFDIIRPLIKETAQKVQSAFPANVQTGPAIRNDIKTLEAHEGLLKDNAEWLTVYKLLSAQIKNNG